jgi:hypothetical protein
MGNYQQLRRILEQSDCGIDHFGHFNPAQPSNPLELAWEKGFAALKKFKAREKHCRVPRGHREGAFNLGTWVVNQRNR